MSLKYFLIFSLFTITSCNNSGDVEQIPKEKNETKVESDEDSVDNNIEEYSPEDTIKSYHEAHPKINKIDCKYCHLSKEKLQTVDTIEGYKPKKAINFPHNAHSKIEGLDCKYCHIPSKDAGSIKDNVCAECHY